jgi:hypothetical protein
MKKTYWGCIAVATSAMAAGVGYWTNGLINREFAETCACIALAGTCFTFGSLYSRDGFFNSLNTDACVNRNYAEDLNNADAARKLVAGGTEPDGFDRFLGKVTGWEPSVDLEVDRGSNIQIGFVHDLSRGGDNEFWEQKDSWDQI